MPPPLYGGGVGGMGAGDAGVGVGDETSSSSLLSLQVLEGP